MYELVQAAENSYYVQSPAKIGLVRTGEKEVCLIDSGSDKDAGRKVRQVLDKMGWQLQAVYNTHSHADHIGGNKYLQGVTGCKVYAPGLEKAFTKAPVLEPMFLYGGKPPKALCHKFLMAQESRTEEMTADTLPAGWEMIPLPGHCFDMVGFRTPDDVVYLADCISSRETLEKYQISFLYDVEAYLDTLEKVKSMQARLFVPSHAEATADIAPLAQYNMDKVHEIAENILHFCREKTSFDALLKKLFDHYRLTLNMDQYVLVGSTVKSYLCWLMEKEKIVPVFENNQMFWLAM